MEVRAKYAGYIERQQEEIERAQRARGDACCRQDLDYAAARRALHEVRQKLTAARPGDARPGGAHPGHHAGRGADPAGAPEEARARRARRSHERLRRAAEGRPGRARLAGVRGPGPGAGALPARTSPAQPRRSSSSTARSSMRPRTWCAPTSRSSRTTPPTKRRTSSSAPSSTSSSTTRGVPVILDVKRGDVGNTAERYAIEAFERYGADAVTVNPYLGTRFARAVPALRGQGRDRAVPHLQPGRPRAAGPHGPGQAACTRWWRSWPRSAGTRAATACWWSAPPNPAELAEVRALVGDMPLLVPGVGAQGGDVAQAVRTARLQPGTGLLISSSRAILYASQGEDFASAARKATADAARADQPAPHRAR